MSVRKRQQGSYTIYIACEGAVSEKEYFEAIRDDAQKLWDVHIEVYPKNTRSANDALSLVNEARNNAGLYKEVWAVFDKDGDVPEDALKEAEKVIDGKKVNVGYSSIAFEHWVLLHFEKNNTAFQKSDCKDSVRKEHFYCGKPGLTHIDDCKAVRCAASNVRKSYIPNYNKKHRFNLYDQIKHKNRNVLENAAWLRFKKGLTVNAVNHANENPYTNLDLLLNKLLNNKETIQWCALDTEYISGNIHFTVSYAKPQLTIKIKHTANERFFDNVFESRIFYVSNDNGEQGEFEVTEILVTKNESKSASSSQKTVSLFLNDEATIKCNVNPSIALPLNFNIRNGNSRFIFEL